MTISFCLHIMDLSICHQFSPLITTTTTIIVIIILPLLFLSSGFCVAQADPDTHRSCVLVSFPVAAIKYPDEG